MLPPEYKVMIEKMNPYYSTVCRTHCGPAWWARENAFTKLIGIIFLAGNTLLLSAAHASPQTDAIPGALSEERIWVEEAELLVERAASAKADGEAFSRDVKAHRARLRNIMQSSGSGLTEEQRELHMSMVLLGVLLKTASGCQAGGRVVCPVTLVSQLRTVLQNTYAKLALVRNPGVDDLKAEQTQ